MYNMNASVLSDDMTKVALCESRINFTLKILPFSRWAGVDIPTRAVLNINLVFPHYITFVMQIQFEKHITEKERGIINV